ncbi:MAG: NHL repeat-containing protein, partial [Candidatus Zixiibacteriota bacterium]
GEQALNSPRGITANSRGDVYVADTGNHRVVRLFNPARKLQYVGSIGKEGSAAGEFISPHGVALDSQGNLYVTDSGNDRVQVFDPEGKFLRAFGRPGKEAGQFIHPDGIAVTDAGEKWSYYHDSFIVVVDLDHTRIQKFSLDGKFLGFTTAEEIGYADAHFAYLAIDYYSNIYVTDMINHCIHKFDRYLNYLTSFGRKGHGDKEFIEPRGIAIYRRFGQVFVIEKESAQYYWVGTDILNPSVNYEKGHLKIDYFLTEPSFVSIDILDGKTNKIVRNVTKKAFRFSGRRTEFLSEGAISSSRHRNRYPNRSRKLSPGRYRVRVKIEPTYSSYHYFSKTIEKEIEIVK